MPTAPDLAKAITIVVFIPGMVFLRLTLAVRLGAVQPPQIVLTRRCVSTPHFYLEFGAWKATSLLLLMLGGLVQQSLLTLN